MDAFRLFKFSECVDISMRSTSGFAMRIYIGFIQRFSKTPLGCQNVLFGNYGAHTEKVVYKILNFRFINFVVDLCYPRVRCHGGFIKRWMWVQCGVNQWRLLCITTETVFLPWLLLKLDWVKEGNSRELCQISFFWLLFPWRPPKLPSHAFLTYPLPLV